MKLVAGAVIAQHYELERLLGEGGMGAVWAARNLHTQARVALKFLKEAAEPELVRRFVREARAASSVRHPNVIGIHDIVLIDEGVPVMVMDLLEGESLAKRLQRTRSIGLTELATIMVPVLSAVGAVHALGIVHRDLKPDNIFLAVRAGQVVPMVLDFGICKLTTPEAMMNDESTLTATGSVLGTPLYMAPEQIFGEPDVDARADVWSLGVMLYECSSGRRPMEGDNVGQLIKQIVTGTIKPLQELVPHAPPEFIKVVEHMLTNDRKERAPDLREAFETLSAMTDVSAQSFGAATTMRFMSAPPASGDAALGVPFIPPAPPVPAVADVAPALSATGAGKPVTSSIAVRARPRSVPLIAAGVGLALLLLVGLVPLLRGRSTPTSEAPVAAAPQPPQAAVSAPTALAPSTAPVAASAASLPSAAPPVASAAVPAASASAAPPQKRAGKPARMLAGGVHGSVPF